jgi:predicted flavoprotein YhiN
VDRHGVPYHEKKLGQLFCDNRSRDILEMLLDECRQAGVELRLRTTVHRIERPGARYLLSTDIGQVASTSLVVATGGLSVPTMGATGFGYEIARQFGHSVLATRAGLVPFVATDRLRELCIALTGTSADSVISCRGQSFRENILFAEKLGGWQVASARTEGYRTAEVTIGGVDTREVSSRTMESLKSPGLYFVGEVLDINGHLGGFKFQWAWASGHAASQFV